MGVVMVGMLAFNKELCVGPSPDLTKKTVKYMSLIFPFSVHLEHADTHTAI